MPTSAFAEVAEAFGGLDALVYTTGMGVCRRLRTSVQSSGRSLFATNVTGASLVTAAAAPHLAAAGRSAVFLSSLGGVHHPVAALGRLRGDEGRTRQARSRPGASSTPISASRRLAVGDSFGGEGDSQTEFNKN